MQGTAEAARLVYALVVMILLQVLLQKPCYALSLL